MMKQGTILIVDDNRNILTSVKLLLADVFEKVVAIANPANIPARFREDRPDVVLLDMNFRSGINNGNEGLYWLGEIKRMRPQTQVVLFTAYADIELAVRGMREGAADFVVKPFDNEKLVDTLKRSLFKTQPSSSNTHKSLQHSLSSEGLGEASREASGPALMFWGTSPAMQDLRLMVEKVAPTDANILITGENGTGKEVLANEIHRLSRRANKKLMPIDMGAISETLFESELFGYVKGAFTDAKSDKPGKFELAEGSSLFLDEIGNLSYALQAKLLTALQRRTIVRVGGTKEIPVDVRLICATNKDLKKMVADGEFREDLLYRINTIHLHLPALRERREDIVPLAKIFVGRYAKMYNRSCMTLSAEAASQIEKQPWHGNIRELQHYIERAVILNDGNEIGPDRHMSSSPSLEGVGEASTLDDIERQAIEKAIAVCHGNLSQVASRLGISRQTLYNKIKRYGL